MIERSPQMDAAIVWQLAHYEVHFESGNNKHSKSATIKTARNAARSPQTDAAIVWQSAHYGVHFVSGNNNIGGVLFKRRQLLTITLAMQIK